jgi:hypothetical protein
MNGEQEKVSDLIGSIAAVAYALVRHETLLAKMICGTQPRAKLSNVGKAS